LKILRAIVEWLHGVFFVPQVELTLQPIPIGRELIFPPDAFEIVIGERHSGYLVEFKTRSKKG
jgi:hypothetical protein